MMDSTRRHSAGVSPLNRLISDTANFVPTVNEAPSEQLVLAPFECRIGIAEHVNALLVAFG